MERALLQAQGEPWHMTCRKTNAVVAPRCGKQRMELQMRYLRTKVLFGVNEGSQDLLFQFIEILII